LNKITFFLFSSLVFLFGCTTIKNGLSVDDQSIQVMSFNIRYDNPNDDENWWNHRRQEVVELIEYYHPDFVGIQEGLHRQVQYLNSSSSDYNYVGVGRDDGETKGEYTAIFYNSTRYEPIFHHTFWLSETPDKISVGWDASMERICTYGAFQDRRTDKVVHIFNAHFDHIGPVSREMSAKVIVKKIEEFGLEKARIVVMGDLNCEPHEKPISVLNEILDDGQEVTRNPFYGPVGTFNKFDVNQIPDRRIDYIFIRNIMVLEYRHIDDRRKNNLCVSDHLPVMAQVK